MTVFIAALLLGPLAALDAADYRSRSSYFASIKLLPTMLKCWLPHSWASPIRNYGIAGLGVCETISNTADIVTPKLKPL